MRRWEPSSLFILMAVSTVLRMPGLSQTLWYDEAYTAWLARMPLVEMVRNTMQDVHPPTWYLIEQATIRLFGVSEAALRLPALVLGVLTVYLTYRLAVRLGMREHHALLAAGLLAANPFAIYYSNEARMYTLLACAVLLAYLGALEHRLWMLGLGTGLALVTHNLAIVYMPVVAALMLLKWGPRLSLKSLRQFASPSGVMVASAVPWAAWVPVMVSQATAGQFANRYWIDSMTGNVFAKLLAEWCLMWFPQFRPAWLGRVGGFVALALIVFPLVEVVRRRKMGWAAVMAFAPGLVSLAISLAWQPVILARTLIASLPAWCILIAWWVTLPRKWDAGKIALVGTAAALVLVCGAAFYQYNRSGDLIGVVNWLKVNNPNGEPVCVESGSAQALLLFYYPEATAITSQTEGQCAFVIDERYMTEQFRPGQAVEKLIALPGATEVLKVTDNPAIKTSVWKVR